MVVGKDMLVKMNLLGMEAVGYTIYSLLRKMGTAGTEAVGYMIAGEEASG